MYYLAYGINTNLGHMSVRCPAATSLGKVILNNHTLRFRRHADADYCPGAVMECALWNITDDCERSLDIVEAYPVYYNKKIVTVEFNRQEISAMIYYMNYRDTVEPPDQGYLNAVLEGYTQHDMSLDLVHRAHAESVKTRY